MWIQSLRLLLHRRCPREFRGGERGQGMLEYAIIGGIVIVGAIAALVALSGALNQIFSKIATTLSQY
ncbi:MAG TPA: Flp family type IVb pilin [bacterium]|nr:Flp family type IVb pilin [bacterium]